MTFYEYYSKCCFPRATKNEITLKLKGVVLSVQQSPDYYCDCAVKGGGSFEVMIVSGDMPDGMAIEFDEHHSGGGLYTHVPYALLSRWTEKLPLFDKFKI